MSKNKPRLTDLGRSERQIMDVIHELGEASVADVREGLADPPSYSAVRTMIRLLESKGFLKHRQEGKRYVYRSTQSRETARQSLLRHMLKTFFGNSATDAVAAILDVSSDELNESELKKLESLVRQARKEGK